MLSAVERLLKKYQSVSRETSTRARKRLSYNIYYLSIFSNPNLGKQPDQTEQTKQKNLNNQFNLYKEIAGDIIGAISLVALLITGLFVVGVYQ